EARKLLHQVFKAFLHKPTVRLKDRNDSDTISALEFLFDLEITSKDKMQI
ncbi:MAG: glutamyl-tRNA reductase, partial [Campylobacter sp.]|nr:glutamyl-tRNA reductase [Campylobacter sp.]